jgi:RecJ-like exonuclease
METTIETEWRPIDGKLLGEALCSAFGTTGKVDDVDINVTLIEALVELLEAGDMVCDHSVGICCCADLYILNELRLWLAKIKTCPDCGGEGIGDFITERKVDDEGNVWEDNIPVPCGTCHGKCTIPLEVAS